MRPELQPFAAAVADWARDNEEISVVWFFGSRVRGDHRDNSDLDIAVLCVGADKGSRLGNYMFNCDCWLSELSRILPVRVHLKNADVELNEPIVGDAVKREGILVFAR